MELWRKRKLIIFSLEKIALFRVESLLEGDEKVYLNQKVELANMTMTTKSCGIMRLMMSTDVEY